MAVFSNKADEFARAVVARYFDADLFEIVRGALPDVPTKPAPEGTRALMASLGVTPDGSVLYVGDSNVDADTAHNAGLPCCGVLWGLPHPGGADRRLGRIPCRGRRRTGKGDFGVRVPGRDEFLPYG